MSNFGYVSLHHDEEDNQSYQSVEEPPFAIVDIPNTLNLEEFKSPSSSQETEKTATDSSIVYSPSQSQSCTQSSSLLEFDAAASLLAESPMLGHSSHFMERSCAEKPIFGSFQHMPPVMQDPMDTKGFSQLMQEADDQNQKSILHEGPLPPLPELGTSLVETTKIADHSIFGCRKDVTSNSTKSNPRASKRPITSFMKRGIETEKINEESFEVSMHIYTPCTLRDVLDIVGNPDMLRLWCEPVRTLVVTGSTEGSRSATQRTEPSQNREVHDGEWIEATTTKLTNPSIHSNRLYDIVQHLWSSLGFPSYGKITMFVERRRGQVGITMGPFPGDLTAFHTIKVAEGDGFIRVVDKVRIGYEELNSDEMDCCCNGVYDSIKRSLFGSKLESHIEHSIASMTRLRVMIENGEIESSFTHSSSLILEEDKGASDLPLLPLLS